MRIKDLMEIAHVIGSLRQAIEGEHGVRISRQVSGALKKWFVSGWNLRDTAKTF